MATATKKTEKVNETVTKDVEQIVLTLTMDEAAILRRICDSNIEGSTGAKWAYSLWNALYNAGAPRKYYDVDVHKGPFGLATLLINQEKGR